MAEGIEVLLICDNKWRDLPGLVLLKLELERMRPSWHVVVASRSAWPALRQICQSNVVVFPTGSEAFIDVASEVSGEGGLSVILPTEGRPTYGFAMEWEVESRVGKQADLILMWSHTMLDVLHRCKRPVARDAVVVGSTRFDFYREPFRGAMLTKREIATRIGTLEGRPLVSWATAFPHAKFWEKNREFHLQDCRQYKYDSEFGMTDDDQMANMRTEHEGRDASVQCLRACATAYPGADFVLKSHPLEDTAFYDNLIRAWRQEGLNNVYFIKGVYIWDILNAATVHIHHNCTTGTEAWLMDKPSVELQFIHLNWERFDMRSSYMGAGAEAREAEDHADSPDAAVAKVGAYLRGEHVSEALLSLRRAYVDKWFYKVDGYATARAVSTLVGTVESRPIRGVSMWSRECFGARLRLRAKEAVGSPFDESLRHPGRPITSEFDAIGHWDRTICQRDVLEWEKKLRKVM